MKPFFALLAIALISTSCSNLGLGEAGCVQQIGDVSSTNILNVQAVPTAKYTPCLDELRLGWDSVEWFAEDGRAGVDIVKSFDTFLTVAVTESCDVSDAIAVNSGFLDIRRFDDVEVQDTEITISVVPSSEDSLRFARTLVAEMDEFQIDDRPVRYIIDGHIGQTVGTRVELAWSRADYMWIIGDLDAEEGTVQQRAQDAAANGRGLAPHDALELIEEVVPPVFYRGDWYFVFEGGCITYEFDATGTLAETVAADASDALGFYPAGELREEARKLGFELE
ncbi:MAG: hypothetical protein ACR2P0_17645 [Acidimicrobiales bacterium]